MSDLIKIAVDAMGGDGSPKKVIDGIIHNHKSNKENFLKFLEMKIKLKNTYLIKLIKNFLKLFIH